MNHSPAAAFDVMALMWRSARWRTSTMVNPKRGRTGGRSVSSRWMMLGLSALADADSEELRATLTPIFRALLAELARYSAA